MPRPSTLLNVALWIAQVLLAALFLFAGVMKLVLPAEALSQGPVVLPVSFLRGIAILELLGGLGLILPGLVRRYRYLTPLAATGLVGIMAGATTVTIEGGTLLPALMPFAAGVVALLVSLGRGNTLAPRLPVRRSAPALLAVA